MPFITSSYSLEDLLGKVASAVDTISMFGCSDSSNCSFSPGICFKADVIRAVFSVISTCDGACDGCGCCRSDVGDGTRGCCCSDDRGGGACCGANGGCCRSDGASDACCDVCGDDACGASDGDGDGDGGCCDVRGDAGGADTCCCDVRGDSGGADAFCAGGCCCGDTGGRCCCCPILPNSVLLLFLFLGLTSESFFFNKSLIFSNIKRPTSSSVHGADWFQ